MNTIVYTCIFIALGFAICADSKTINRYEPIRDLLFREEFPARRTHAATLVQLSNGQFFVAFFAGEGEREPDVGIWACTGTPGNWTYPREIAKINNIAHWNPVLHRTSEGKIILYFKVGDSPKRWETWVQESIDEGLTWSEARELVPGDVGGRGPVKNKLLVLSDGAWLAGASHESILLWQVFVDRSEDQGLTWERTPYVKYNRTQFELGRGAIQPTLWESAPGKVHMLVRTTGGWIGRADSEDYGKTWNTIYRTTLPNPSSGIDVVKLSDGTLVLIYNPGVNEWGTRGQLSAAYSSDNGATWSEPINIEAEHDYSHSYPAIINFGDDDSIAVAYTWRKEKIGFWMVTKAGLMEMTKRNK